MNKSVFHVGHGAKQFVATADDKGNITLTIAQSDRIGPAGVFVMSPEVATKLAVALTTAAFPHIPTMRAMPPAARVREDGEGPLPQMMAQRHEQLRHQDDAGDACQCANCVLSMG